MRQNTAASVPAAMQWDELRIGSSWVAVTALPLPPAVDVGPQNQTVMAGQSATFNVSASGSAPLHISGASREPTWSVPET